jgi:acyl-coenzyme A thioesterase PaaI-like protein
MHEDNPAHLGLRFSVEPPGLVARFVPRPEHRGAPGLLHGGLAATALDEVMGGLGWALDGRHTMTATLNLRYRHPVPLDGREVSVESWRPIPEPRRRQRVFGRLRLADGTVAVEAAGIFVQRELDG